MKRNMLSARKVQTAGIGWHADGGGLYLQVTPGGRSWVFRFKLDGHERYMGLGSTENVTLAEAREKAAAARKLRSEGVDPIEHRKAQRTAMQLSATKAMTFKQCADAFIASHEAGWNSAKHRQQWVNTLAQHVHPVLGALPVNAIDTAMVMKAIGPLWTTIPETASRVRGRIEAILDWARVSGYRTGENCARWRGHLDHLLPASSKVRKTEHLAALPYVEVGAFMAKLRAQDGPAARCLEFIVLTAARLRRGAQRNLGRNRHCQSYLDDTCQENERRSGAPSPAEQCRSRGAPAEYSPGGSCFPRIPRQQTTRPNYSSAIS